MTDHEYGPKGHIVDAFLDHLRGMSADDWDKFYAAWAARVAAIGIAAWVAAWDEAERAARQLAAWGAAGPRERLAAGLAAGFVSRDDARVVTRSAVWEIQGADLMLERGQSFFFLPLFGFADEQAVCAALQPKEGEK